MLEPTPTESVRTMAGFAGGENSRQEPTALLIDAKAAAGMLTLGARTLWTLSKYNAGRIPALVAGRSILVHVPTVALLISERT